MKTWFSRNMGFDRCNYGFCTGNYGFVRYYSNEITGFMVKTHFSDQFGSENLHNFPQMLEYSPNIDLFIT